MISNFDLIIFDCDGTLVDSEYLNNKVSSDLLIEFGLIQYLKISLSLFRLKDCV